MSRSATVLMVVLASDEVVLRGSGYLPSQPHPQHIHGSIGGRHFTCPTIDSDNDGAGVLTNEEGVGGSSGILLAGL